MTTDSLYWGYHLILDCSGCNLKKVTDPEALSKWVKSLVKKIDMVPYGEPQVVHFGKDEPHLAGWTVIQLIETSNITAHFCDLEGDAYVDVFSCKYFDKTVVEAHFQKTFKPKNMSTTLLTRQAPK